MDILSLEQARKDALELSAMESNPNNRAIVEKWGKGFTVSGFISEHDDIVARFEKGKEVKSFSVNYGF